MLRHLRRYLPKELASNTTFPLSIEEIGHNIRIEPFPWLYKQYNADADLTRNTVNLLNRPHDMPIGEITISLRSNNAAPRTLRDRPATMSDVPIVANKEIESRREFFDPSPEIFKFMIATHVVPITVSKQVYDDTMNYVQEHISSITNSHPVFRKELGKGGILDMNIHGKPLSLLHIALSKGRSNVQQEINEDTVKKAVRLFEMNINDTLDKWRFAFPEEGKYDFSGTSAEQQRMIGFIIKNGPSTPDQVYAALTNEMSYNVFARMWYDLYHNQRAIYEKDTNTFDVVPFFRK